VYRTHQKEKEASEGERSAHSAERRTHECPICEITGDSTAQYWRTEIQAKRRSDKGENTGTSAQREYKSGKNKANHSVLVTRIVTLCFNLPVQSPLFSLKTPR
jgi:hypothetical protein